MPAIVPPYPWKAVFEVLDRLDATTRDGDLIGARKVLAENREMLEAIRDELVEEPAE